MKSLKALLGAIFLALSIPTLAVPVISVGVDPSRSFTGEPVLLKVTARNDNRAPVKSPMVQQLADWDVLNISETAFPTAVIKNGQIIYRFEGEFTYVLKPLRTGTLKIPSLE